MTIEKFSVPPSVPVAQMLDFRGQTVCVTGARKGLGQGIAERFAEAGANIIVHARQREDADATCRKVEAFGVKAASAAADLTNDDAFDKALAEAEAVVGPVSILINNAGAYPVEPLDALSADNFERVVQANLGTAFRATQVCARRWSQRTYAGSIVNISSVESTRPAYGHTHYASAKAALDMFTQASAFELGPQIRVNAVAPGLIHYPELETLWPEGVARYRSRAIMKREGDRREVADVCLFLSSPGASWITGTVIVVDGGISAAPHF